MKKLFLIDGSALAYRCYFALIRRPLYTKKGLCTSAIYGFANSLLSIIEDESPDYLAVVFDAPEPTFRHKLFAEYKATREKMPDELQAQLPYIHRMVELLGISLVVKPGFEADDIIGTLAKEAEKKGIATFIVGADKDFMQLVSDTIRMYDNTKREAGVQIIDPKGVKERFGVGPEGIVDLFALMGDSSDNVPGAKGVGEKTALDLIARFHTVEEVLKHAANEPNKRVREGLINSVENIRLSQRLVTIDTNVPLDVEVDDLKPRSPDGPRLLELFEELEFESLKKRVKLAPAAAERQYRIVSSLEELDWLVRELDRAKEFVFDVETTSKDPIGAEIIGISFAWKEGEAHYVPVSPGPPTMFDGPRIQLSLAMEKLKPVLENPAIPKGGQNVKYDMIVLSNYGIGVQGIRFDPMVASYVLDPSARQHNLELLSAKYLGLCKTPTEALIGKGKKQISMTEVPLEEVARYSCEDADFALRLHHVLTEELKEKRLLELYQEVEVPLIPVLARMEERGVKVDVELLGRLSTELGAQIAQLESEIQQLAGMSFNLNSPQQLGAVLFERLQVQKGIPKFKPKKTKTGYSTDSDTLEALSSHPIVSKLLQYRSLTKLKGTYLDALPALVNGKTGRIHTSFNQTTTATGRLSSSDPNLQNIPIRDEIGRQIRRAFVPSESGRVIMSADYSQIELRILAHIAGDPGLREAFVRGEDVHTRTASTIFGVPVEEVTPVLRNRCKAINYGIAYGMGPQLLSRQAGISVEEAQRFIEAYFRLYPKIKEYMDRAIETARREGFVTTILGRRRYIPEINSSNGGVRVNAEHAAINTPIQGSAADLIKLAMIRIDEVLRRDFPGAYMILQVHDELDFDVPAGMVDRLKPVIKAEMEAALELEVPIVVEVKVGANWLEAH